MAHSGLFVFDIETIPDTEAASNLLDMQNDSDINILREGLSDYHLSATDGKSAFPRQTFHKVVCVSFVSADIEAIGGKEYYRLKEIRTGGKVDSPEQEIISRLSSHLGREKPRLVSFNGRTFDMPVLKYRALKYNIPFEWFYKSGDKWNSYTQRYSLDWHCDLLEAFSDFGASARIKMKEICALLSIPCKYGNDGGDVMQMYDADKIKDIRNYCEIDAMTTYILYLRYALHTGLTDLILYEKSLSELVVYIQSERIERPHLGEFLDLWLKLVPNGRIV